MSFWDIIWFIIVAFAFIFYLMVLFSIIGDLFRDHETSGWVKAIWVIFLLFFPLITALVYLIARGQGMAQRSMKQGQELKAMQDDYIRSVAGGGGAGAADQIAKAHDLLAKGAITQAEYDSIKAKALA